MSSSPLFPGEKRPWNHSLADFVACVLLYEAAGTFKIEGYNMPADVIGEFMLLVYDIDISPYPDFHTLRISVSPSFDAEKVISRLERWKSGEE